VNVPASILALGLVGADVLDGGAEEASEQREQLDLLFLEGIGLGADDREHPDRLGAREQRHHDTAAQPELEEGLLLGMSGVCHVAPVDGLAGAEHLFEHGARHCALEAGREDVLRADSRRCDHARRRLVGEHDRRPVERHEPAKLADEGPEGLLEVERRAERAGAAVGRVEQIGPPPELVPKLLRFDGALPGESGLADEPFDEPAHDQADDHPHADGQGHVVEVETLVEVLGVQVLEPHVHGCERERQRKSANQAVTKSRLDDRHHERLPDRRPRLERVDEHVRADDCGVEDECDKTEPSQGPAGELSSARPDEAERAQAEADRGDPSGELVASAREALAQDEDLQEREGESPEAHPGDPALGLLKGAARRHQAPSARSSRRAQAHSAYSRRSGSSSVR
jgi:hypothetical protein